MRALGELLISNLNYHLFVDFVYDYQGEKAAFITGWTYWFCWSSLAMDDVTAAEPYKYNTDSRIYLNMYKTLQFY